VVQVEQDAVATVHEAGIMDHRVREARAVMQVMVVAPGTTTLVVMVEKEEAPRGAQAGEVMAAMAAVAELKTAAARAAQRAVVVMLTI